MGAAASCRSGSAVDMQPQYNPDGEEKPPQSFQQRKLDIGRLKKAVARADMPRIEMLLKRMPLHQINFVPVYKPLCPSFTDCKRGPSKLLDTVLHSAVKSRNIQVTKLLLEYKADPDVMNGDGMNPLLTACTNVDVDIVQELLQNEANPDVCSPEGMYPIHISVEHGSVAMVELLVKYDANLNLLSSRRETALHMSISKPGSRGMDMMANAMIDSNRMNFSVRDGQQDTAPMKATRVQNTGIAINMVNHGANTNLHDADGLTILHMAIQHDTAPCTILALAIVAQRNTDVNVQSMDTVEATPLYMAVDTHNQEVVQSLLDREADADIKAKSGSAPLHLSIPRIDGPEHKRSLAISRAIIRTAKQGLLDTNLLDAAGDSVEMCEIGEECQESARRAQLLIDKGGADVNSQNADGNTALHLSVRHHLGCMRLFNMMMEAKANCNIVNKEGSSPLHLAVTAIGALRHAHSMSLAIIKCGRADLDIQDACLNTALALAATGCYTDLVGALLDEKASPDIANDNLDTPLIISGSKQDVDSMDLLIQHQANVNCINEQGNTALHTCLLPLPPAGGGWSSRCAQLLLACGEAQLDVQNKNGESPVLRAAKMLWWSTEGLLEVVKTMVAQGCNPNLQDDEGRTAIHYSLRLERPARESQAGDKDIGPGIALALLESPTMLVDTEAKDGSLLTALHLAAIHAFTDVSSKLISRAADPNPFDAQGETALHKAVVGCTPCHDTVALQLVAYDKTDLDLVTKAKGRTALLIAVLGQRADVAEALIKKGANPNIVDKAGLTALHAAIGPIGHYTTGSIWETMALVIIDSSTVDLNILNPTGDTPLHAGIAVHNTPVVDSLVKHGTDLNLYNKKGCTALHCACYSACEARQPDDQELACIIINGGANLSFADPQERTPLHLSVAHIKGSFVIFKAAMVAGADPNLLDSNTDTPLHLAVTGIGKVEDAWEMSHTIIKCGRADLDIQDACLNTALALAATGCYTDLVGALLDEKASPDIANDNLDTPLIISGSKQDADSMDLLIQHQANVNCINEQGNTALHTCLLPLPTVGGGWSARCAQLLLACEEAQLDVQNKNGESPVLRAAKMLWWSTEGLLEVVKTMVAQGCNPNLQDDEGRTAIHYSLRLERPARESQAGDKDIGPGIALALLESPTMLVDTEAKDGSLLTALHLAAIHAFTDVSSKLISRAADPNPFDAQGETALHKAVVGCTPCHDTVALQLVAYDKTDLDLVTKAKGQTALLIAVLLDKESIVKASVKKGANPNIVDKADLTALHAAIGRIGTASAAIVTENALCIVKCGRTNLDFMCNGKAPLHLSLSVSSTSVLKALVDAGANLDIKDEDGCTPLHRAMYAAGKSVNDPAKLERAAILINGGADLTIGDPDGDTPCHLAVATALLTTFRLLMEKGADPNLFNKKRDTVLHTAIKVAGGVTHAIDMALDMVKCPRTKIDLVDGSKRTAMLLAVLHVQPGILEGIATETKANPNICDNDGDCALQAALRLAESEKELKQKEKFVTCCNMAISIISCGRADLDILGMSEWTPLHIAVRIKTTPVVQALVNGGANLNLKGPDGQTALHMSIKAACAAGPFEDGDVDRSLAIIRGGSDLHVADACNDTPLHLVVAHRHGCKKLFDELMERKVNPNLKNTEGNTCLHACIKSVNRMVHGEDMAIVIITCGRATLDLQDKAGSTAMLLAVQHCLLPTLKALILGQADPNIVNGQGECPLHCAIELFPKSGDAYALAVISYSRANVNILNPRGRSPLHEAVAVKALGIVTALVGRGANCNAKDKSGLSPLHCAIQGATSTKECGVWVSMCKVMTDGKANVNLQTPDGHAALHLVIIGVHVHMDLFNDIMSYEPDLELASFADRFSPLHHVASRLGEMTCAMDMARSIVGCRRANLDQEDKGGRTALMIGVHKLHPPFCKFMHDARANPNIADGRGAVPMQQAFRTMGEWVDTGAQSAGHAESVQIALDMVSSKTIPVKLDILYDGEDAPLHLATKLCRVDLVTAIIGTKRASLNLLNGRGNAALHLAITRATIAAGIKMDYFWKIGKEIIEVNMAAELIREQSIDLELYSGERMTPLMYAVIHCQHGLVTMLLKASVDPNKKNGRGYVAIHLALPLSGSTEGMEISMTLIMHPSTDRNMQDPDGNPVLHVAAHKNRSQMLTQALLVADSNLEIPSPRDLTPLLVACINKEFILQLVPQLLNNGANPNRKDPEGSAALHNLLRSGSKQPYAAKAIYALVQNSALNENGTDAERVSYLLLGFRNGYFQTARQLLQRGADPNLKSGRGDSLLHGVVLKSIDTYGNAPVHLFVSKDALSQHADAFLGCAPKDREADSGMVNLVLEVTSKLNSKDNKERTVLFLAVSKANWQVAGPIAKSGRASLNLTDGYGDTPLLEALRLKSDTTGAPEFAQLLVSLRADVSPCGNEKAPALALAMAHLSNTGSYRSLCLDIIRTGYRVDLNCVHPKEGRPVLHMALHNDEESVAVALLDHGADVNKRSSGQANMNLQTADGHAALHLVIIDGNTPLHLVVKSDRGVRGKYARILLGKRADPNCLDGDNNTSLQALLSVDYDTNVGKMLLDGGAKSGLTRLRNHFRVEGLRYSSVVLDSLLEQRSVDEEITPLTLAVLIYRQMAPVLLGLGAHVKDSRQRKTVTPLVAACLIGESDMVAKGLYVQGADGYYVNLVPAAIQRGLSHILNEATNVVIEEVLRTGQDIVTGEAGGAAGEEVGGEVASALAEVAGEVLLDVGLALIPGLQLFSVLRWTWKLFSWLASEPKYTDALNLQNPGPMSIVKCLVQRGAGVRLSDSGMKEMVMMIVSAQDDQGWAWAGLNLQWPSSFEPERSNGRNKIINQAEQEEWSSSDRSGALDKWDMTVKITKTMKALRTRAQGRG
eukprot:gene8916-3808_t